MKLCVTTAYDPGFAELGDIAAASVIQYAERHGLEHRIRSVIPDGRPPAWGKIPVIRELLEEGFDFVLWIDADALFVRFDADVRDEIEDGKDFYLAVHTFADTEMPELVGHPDTPCTGVMLFRNSEWSLAFLDAVWAKTEYIEHEWWEQAAILDLLGYRSILGGGLEDTRPAEVLDRVRFIDLNWDSYPGACVGDDPIILHYPRRHRETRIRDMRRARYGRDLCDDEIGRLRGEIEEMRSGLVWRTGERLWGLRERISRIFGG